MRTLIDQLEASLGSKLYFLSLFAALALPDIAGALGSKDGDATPQKYADWYDEWAAKGLNAVVQQERVDWRQKRDDMMRARGFPVSAANLSEAEPTLESPVSGEMCYAFRNKMLHQGRAIQHSKSPKPRIIFVEPGATTNRVFFGKFDDKALLIDVDIFCRQMIAGARLWLTTAEATENYKRNYSLFARRHPQGIEPFMVGVPVIG